MASVDSTPAPATGRRRQVLDELRAASRPLSILELASRLDMHPNTVRFHLDALTTTEQVERVDQSPSRRGRPPLVFRAREGMDPTGPRGYRLLSSILADSLADLPDGPARAAAAGRRWGERLVRARESAPARTDRQAVDTLLTLLEELGFAPELLPGEAAPTIGLRHCPFLELTRGDTRLICPVHLGLMQGVLAEIGASTTVDRLVPFVEPGLCVAHLARSRSKEKPRS
jgi:predicted ArsR family transcriptional regulator